MDRFFSSVGKAAAATIVAGVLIILGSFVLDKLKPTHIVKSAATPTPTIELMDNATNPAVPTATPLPNKTRFALNAGGVKPFIAYTLSGVNGWTPTKTADASTDKVVLTNGDYQITITQGGFGAATCIFPGMQPAEMSMALTNPVDIGLMSGVALKRGTAQSATANQASFVVCEREQTGAYASATDYGAINYTTPVNPSQEMLAEMDAMVGSLQQQQQ